MVAETMNKSELSTEIGQEILNSRDLQNKKWESLALVIDLSEGHFSQSGYLYSLDDAEPFTAISSERRKLSSLCQSLKEKIKSESSADILQMLVQIKSYDMSIKIDFEFQNPSRWSITPNNMDKMKETLKP